MKQLFVLPLLITVMLSFSCSKSDNPVGVTSKDFTYPLTRGNQWHYQGQTYYTNFRGDTTIFLPRDTTISTISVEITGQELLPNNVIAYVLHEEFNFTNGHLRESDAYYNNFEDGLFLYGYKGGSTLIPKTNPAVRNVPGAREFYTTLQPEIAQGNYQQDTLFLVQPASKSLQYPMAPGEIWTHNNNTGTLKSVLEVVDVKIPAGTFKCAKVEWQLGSDIEFFDYISAGGLIKRSVLRKGLQLVPADQPDAPPIIVDAVNEYILTSYAIKN